MAQGFHFWLGAKLAELALGLGLLATIAVVFGIWLGGCWLWSKLERRMP